MATRAAIGKYTAPGRWTGVYHHWSGAPWDLGNLLAARVRAAGGDLTAVVKEIIDDVPGGWSRLSEGKALGDGETYDQRSILESELEWAYVFDLDQRRLDVFEIVVSEEFQEKLVGPLSVMRANAPAPEAGLRLHGTVEFDDRGNPNLTFIRPRATWEIQLPSREESAENRARAETVRAGIREHLDGLGHDAAELRARVISALRVRLEGALDVDLGDGTDVRFLYRPGTDGLDLRRLSLDRGGLVYGYHPEARINWCSCGLRSSAVVGTSTPSFFVPEGAGEHDAEAVLDLVFGIILGLVKAGQVQIDHEPSEYEVMIDGDKLELFAFYRVVDGVPGKGEMNLAEAREHDPAVEVGDELGPKLQLPNWQVELFRWLEG